MYIKIDIHEKNPKVKQDLDKLGYDTEVVSLSAGDYTFNTHNGKSVGIERKTATDLVSTISAQRFLTQVQKLVDEYEIRYVLIAGRVSCSKRNLVQIGRKERQLPYKFVIAQFAAAYDLGAQLVQIDSDDQSGLSIAQLYDWHQEVDHSSFVAQPRARLPKSKDAAQLKLLMALPGIGHKTAKKILETHGSFQEFLDNIQDTKCLNESSRIEIMRVING